MYEIVSHPNYAGMPCTIDDDGKIDWTIPSNRPPGSKNWDGNIRRREWWAQRAHDLGIPTEGHWISKAAKRIHPTGTKPCQTCGREMRLAYVYPTARTTERLNSHLPDGSELEWGDLLDIDEVVDHLYAVIPEGAGIALRDVFEDIGEPKGAEEAKSDIRRLYTARESAKLSPGAMSNAPDRLDGFHTYNLCCRSTQDTGRDAGNLQGYSTDRRAFEHWTEGDWSAANFLMSQTGWGTCPSCGEVGALTADHVGPLSLGFAHTPNFQVRCRACNSAKNNRMSAADVSLLIENERIGVSVSSFQVKYLWNHLKGEVQTDSDALLLSKLMRINQHHYLIALAEAIDLPDVLLQFLSPEFAENSVQVVELNPLTLEYVSLIRVPRSSGYAASKSGRMIRIAFDALRDYAGREHRNVQVVHEQLVTRAFSLYRASLDRARSNPSRLRTPMREILESGDPDEIRSRRLITLLAGSYAPEVDYGYVNDALASLMAAIGGILAVRFDRGESVSWND
jgi:Alw26I/Eco31I/Esp3I family type II restriction endonuclease